MVGNTFTGWVPQPDDSRDWIYKPPPGQTRKPSVDLRDTHYIQRTPYDQGDLSSCTSNAIASALRYGINAEGATARAGRDAYQPSRLFMYYYTRILNATDGNLIYPDELQKVFDTKVEWLATLSDDPKSRVKREEVADAILEDEGGWERNALKALTRYGVCSEAKWPYMPSNTTARRFIKTTNYRNPPAGANAEGLKYIDPQFSYWRIKDLGEGTGPNMIAHMEAALSEGFPVIFAFWGSKNNAPLQYDEGGLEKQGLTKDFVYKGWMKEGDDKINKNVWGHCVLAIGYDSKKDGGRFLILNSWGPKFGDGGYFWMPYTWFMEGKGMWKNKDGQMVPRIDDLWVVKNPMPQKGTAGTDVTPETSRNAKL
jgi:C1A family cysteine protease